MFKWVNDHMFIKVGKVKSKFNFLKNDWKLFEQKDTYLTYRGKNTINIKLIELKQEVDFLFRFRFLLNHDIKKSILDLKTQINTFEENIFSYNDRFIEIRLGKYQSFFEGKDDNLKTFLDDEQRRAVITDDQYNLVVAAAGSGKTNTLIARIAYLIRRKDVISPNRILALAFNKNAATEISNRLISSYHIDNVNVRTFHSFAYQIIKEHDGKVDEPVDTNKVIDELFTQLLKTNDNIQKLYIHYLGNYIQVDKKEHHFKTKDEYHQYMRNMRYMTLSGEEVRSHGEKEIANFLYINNIRFEYEKLAGWANSQSSQHAYHPDFYLPDYDIYIEHWGLSREGKVASWFSKTSQEYNNERLWKIKTFSDHNKTLVQTWDYERLDGTLLGELKSRLKGARSDIAFKPLTIKELIEVIFRRHEDKNREMKKILSAVITHCISNFIDPDRLQLNIQNTELEEKSKHFGEIAVLVFREYVTYLNKNHKIDYSGMINKSINIINSNEDKYRDRYDHILIDEFQDISFQRLCLIQSMVNESTNTKLFCVGDDWQSIYKFAGSEVNLFVNFKDIFKEATISYLTTNYRSTNNIVDMSTNLISYNQNKLDKKVVSKSLLKGEIVLYKIADKYFKTEYEEQQSLIIINKIKELLNSGVKTEDILILSRFNNPLYFIKGNLDKNNISVKLESIHATKGTQAKYVFIINLVSGIYGFPSEIEDDSVLEIVKMQEDKLSAFEEERRLFYVALTRSKEFIYLFTHKSNESIFLFEIQDYIKSITPIS